MISHLKPCHAIARCRKPLGVVGTALLVCTSLPFRLVVQQHDDAQTATARLELLVLKTAIGAADSGSNIVLEPSAEPLTYSETLFRLTLLQKPVTCTARAGRPLRIRCVPIMELPSGRRQALSDIAASGADEGGPLQFLRARYTKDISSAPILCVGSDTVVLMVSDVERWFQDYLPSQQNYSIAIQDLAHTTPTTRAVALRVGAVAVLRIKPTSSEGANMSGGNVSHPNPP